MMSPQMYPQRSAVGERILTLLSGRGKKAAWLASRAGISPATVSRVIRGLREPSLDTLAAMGLALGVTVEQLTGGVTSLEVPAHGRRLRMQEDGPRGVVSREHFDAALTQLVEFERQASEQRDRADRLALDAQQERAMSRASEARAREAELAAATAASSAARYQAALVRAIADVAELQTELGTLRANAGEPSVVRPCASVRDYLGAPSDVRNIDSATSTKRGTL